MSFKQENKSSLKPDSSVQKRQYDEQKAVDRFINVVNSASI